MPSSDAAAAAAPGRPASLTWRRWIGRLLTAGLATLLLAAVFHRPLLRGVARAWVVEQTAGPADAIVVSTGARPELFQQALAWWREGRAPRLVLTRSESKPTDRAGITVPEAHSRRRVEGQARGRTRQGGWGPWGRGPHPLRPRGDLNAEAQR